MPSLQRAPSREYKSIMMDSRRWNGYRPRPGDSVVATYPKCGTTWTQRIVDLLIHQSTGARPINQTYPWLDATFFAPVEADLATLEGQTHRRSIKSHLPFDALPIYEGVKYIHVVRDGRDACFSMHNHQLGFSGVIKEGQIARAIEHGATPLPPTPEDPRDFYLQWIAEAEAGEDVQPGWDMPFFEFEMTYWRERKRPNLLFVHYNDLKADLAGEIARIAGFLEIDTPPDRLAEFAEAAKFESMKAQGPEILPMLAFAFDRGSDRFLNKGTNGRWKGALTDADLARFDRLATAKFTPSARSWIENGRLVAGDPAEAPD